MTFAVEDGFFISGNPVKHGYVSSPKDWRFSTFLRCVQQGVYEIDWADVCSLVVKGDHWGLPQPTLAFETTGTVDKNTMQYVKKYP